MLHPVNATSWYSHSLQITSHTQYFAAGILLGIGGFLVAYSMHGISQGLRCRYSARMRMLMVGAISPSSSHRMLLFLPP